VLERGFEGVEIVDSTRACLADLRADRCCHGEGPTVPFFVEERGEGFVNCSVVAIMEDEIFRALGDFARDADGEAIGVSAVSCELPVRQRSGALGLRRPKGASSSGEH